MNKRRIWATSPVYYVMAAVMFIMACFSYTQNKILFAVEITVSGLCLAAVIMTDLHYRVHVYTALRAARKVLSADEQRNLGQFALPLAVLGSAGDIVWTNERFQDYDTFIFEIHNIWIDQCQVFKCCIQKQFFFIFSN